jgi:hypothetical protein
MNRIESTYAAVKQSFEAAVAAKRSGDSSALYLAMAEIDTNLRRLDRELKVALALAE